MGYRAPLPARAGPLSREVLMRRRAFLGALLGAAAGPPLTASAQPTEKGARRRIAIVHLGGTEATVSEGGAPRWRAFFAELRQRGYAVDKNLVVNVLRLNEPY